MTTAKAEKCAHPVCSCVPTSGKYCSDPMRSHGKDAGHRLLLRPRHLHRQNIRIKNIVERLSKSRANGVVMGEIYAWEKVYQDAFGENRTCGISTNESLQQKQFSSLADSRSVIPGNRQRLRAAGTTSPAASGGVDRGD